jgi:hypothetical protein
MTDPETARAHRILVIDDNRLGARSMQIFLEDKGHSVELRGHWSSRHRSSTAVSSAGRSLISVYLNWMAIQLHADFGKSRIFRTSV